MRDNASYDARKSEQWNDMSGEAINHIIASFILKCEQCRKNKHNIYKAYSVSQKIEPVIKKWQLIMINFIIKLPKSKDLIIKVTYNNI